MQEKIKAMTHGERHMFLAAALRIAPRYYPLFFVLAGTGMRLGQALALQSGDTDYSGKTIRIVRAFFDDGTLGTPKSGYGRQSTSRTVSPARLLPMRDEEAGQAPVEVGGTAAVGLYDQSGHIRRSCQRPKSSIARLSNLDSAMFHCAIVQPTHLAQSLNIPIKHQLTLF